MAVAIRGPLLLRETARTHVKTTENRITSFFSMTPGGDSGGGGPFPKEISGANWKKWQRLIIISWERERKRPVKGGKHERAAKGIFPPLILKVAHASVCKCGYRAGENDDSSLLGKEKRLHKLGGKIEPVIPHARIIVMYAIRYFVRWILDVMAAAFPKRRISSFFANHQNRSSGTNERTVSHHITI